jgi:hypothetical protein
MKKTKRAHFKKSTRPDNQKDMLDYVSDEKEAQP